MANNAARRRSSRTPRDMTPEDYGCKATGDSNAVPMAAAMAAAAEEQLPIDFRGKTFISRAQLEAPPSQRLWLRNGLLKILPDSPIIVTGSTNLFNHANTTWPAVGTLTDNALRGTSVLKMNSVGDLQPGDHIIPWSNFEMTGYLPPYSRACDWNQVREVNGLTVTLFKELQMDFNVADGAAVIKVLKTGGVMFKNFGIIGGGMGKSERGFTSQYGYFNYYDGFSARNLERSGLGELMCMFSRNVGQYQYEATLSAEAGYGISHVSVFGCDYGRIHTRRARHAITGGAPSALSNRLSGFDNICGDVISLDAGGAAVDQHPGVAPFRCGDVYCVMANDADKSSPAIVAQGGGVETGRVTNINGSTGAVSFQCLGWYQYPGFVPELRVQSVAGNGASGLITAQNRTNKGGAKAGHAIALYLGEPGGSWDNGVRAQAYDGHVEVNMGAGSFTCFNKAVYLQSSAKGRAVVNFRGTKFKMTGTTTTPIILQGKAWADAHPGELGCELHFWGGGYTVTKKEITNSYGMVVFHDVAEPAGNAISQEGGQSKSPVHRWDYTGKQKVFTALEEDGINLFDAAQKFSIAGYPVLRYPLAGYKTPAGTALKDGSTINVDTITATDANVRLLGGLIKGLMDASLYHGGIRFTHVLPPVNIIAPVVTGIPAVGAVLTAAHGTWTNTPTGYVQGWFSDGVAIPGETGLTYTQVTGDLTKKVTYGEYATNAGGQSLLPAISNEIATGRPYIITPPVLIYADLKIGSTITCPDGIWGNAPTGYGDQWYRDLVSISGATAGSRGIAIDDDGGMLRCDVTATNAYGSVTVSSNAVGPIEAGWTMRNFPGLADWGYADYLTEGTVATWPGVLAVINFAQATAGSRVTKSATSFNGHAGVSAAAGGRYMETSPIGVPAGVPVGTTAGWIFIVQNLPSGAGGQSIAYGFNGAGTGRYVQQQTAAGQPDGLATFRASSPTAPSAALRANPLPDYGIGFAQWHPSGLVEFWANGAKTPTSAYIPGTINTGNARFRLFAGAGGAVGTPWPGEIAHWAVGTGVAEVADIQRAMGLGAWWCDLQALLPEDHPYKHVPPWEV